MTVLCVGKLKEKFYIDAAAEYAKRLSRFCKLELVELPEERLPEDPSPAQIEAALLKEAAAIRAKLPAGAAGSFPPVRAVPRALRRDARVSGVRRNVISTGSRSIRPPLPSACWPPR